jgi:hypothetical protein
MTLNLDSLEKLDELARYALGEDRDAYQVCNFYNALTPDVALSLIAEVRRLREGAALPGVRIESYSIPQAGFDIIRTEQRTGPAKWKVLNGGYCLTKTGDWEWEPLPSSRTDEFIQRCRFDSAQEAIDAARAQQKETK